MYVCMCVYLCICVSDNTSSLKKNYIYSIMIIIYNYMEHRALWFMVFYDGLRQGAFRAVLENDRSLQLSKNGTHAF